VGGVDLDAGGAAHLVGELFHGERLRLLLVLAGGEVAALPSPGGAGDEKPGHQREGGQTWISRHVPRYAGLSGPVQPWFSPGSAQDAAASRGQVAQGGRVAVELVPAQV